MKKRFLSAGLAVVMAASLTACGGSDSASTTAAAAGESKAEGESAAAGESSAAADGAVFKIGGIGPVTGGAAVYGLAVQHGAEVAVKEINEAGGINGAQIEFQFQDDEHDAEKSVNAYNTLKDWGMQALVGTTTSAPCTFGQVWLWNFPACPLFPWRNRIRTVPVFCAVPASQGYPWYALRK